MKNILTKNLRAIVILVFAVAIMVGYVLHIDIGNLSSLGFGLVSAICPVGFLETLLASKTFVPRALFSFVIVIILIVILGKSFCAWICPTALIQRLLPKKRDKQLKPGVAVTDSAAAGCESCDSRESFENRDSRGSLGESCQGKHKNIKLDSRHLVLGGSLVSAAVFGFPVFCLVCPVGLIFASLLVITRLFTHGEASFTVLLFPAILILELVLFRKWCAKICPLGALASLLSGLNRFFRPKIDDSKCLVSAQGSECFLCSKACDRENIDLRRPSLSRGALSDCTKCRDCADACPAKAISFPLLPRE